MKVTTDKRVLIVGLGLIGGSYAKALTKKGYRVSAITGSRSSIDFALDNGVIEAGSTQADPQLIGSADIVVFALYPKGIYPVAAGSPAAAETRCHSYGCDRCQMQCGL